jgi:hypothetical protein
MWSFFETKRKEEKAMPRGEKTFGPERALRLASSSDKLGHDEELAQAPERGNKKVGYTFRVFAQITPARVTGRIHVMPNGDIERR